MCHKRFIVPQMCHGKIKKSLKISDLMLLVVIPAERAEAAAIVVGTALAVEVAVQPLWAVRLEGLNLVFHLD